VENVWKLFGVSSKCVYTGIHKQATRKGNKMNTIDTSNSVTVIMADDFSIHRKGCADINRNCGGEARVLGTFGFTTWAELATWYAGYWADATAGSEIYTTEELLKLWKELGDMKPCVGLR
jgi:hypothetical protein